MSLGVLFRILLGAHEPGEPVEASLVLMALAAINGRNRDGSPMQGDNGRGATVAALSRELGLRYPDAVERGLAALVEVGAARREADGWQAVEAALAHRARDPRTWLRLDERARHCGVVEMPTLFVVALALGQLDERNGHAVLGRTRIAELTGWHGTGPKTAGKPSSRVDRAIRQAVRSGALVVRSRLPGSGLPCYVPGPGGRQGDATNESPTENRVTRRTRAAEADTEQGHATNPLRSRDKPNRVTRRTEQGDATNAVQDSGVQDHQECARTREALPEPAAPDAGGGGPGTATNSRSSTETATPSPPPTAAEIRNALHQFRDEGRLRELLTDDREQAAEVSELLRLVGFAEKAIAATVGAIVEHRGDDAARWTLDELHDIATDPTADVPAVFRWRIAKGRHNPENEEKTTEKGMNSRPRRPLHDGGAEIRKANIEAAEKRRAEDPSRLRDVVRGMVTDRKPFDLIAEATGATLAEVETIAAEVAGERAGSSQRRSPKQTEADEVEAAVRIVRWCIGNDRAPPQQMVATLSDAGRWPL